MLKHMINFERCYLGLFMVNELQYRNFLILSAMLGSFNCLVVIRASMLYRITYSNIIEYKTINGEYRLIYLN
jgi:integral membrane sensor domain MASE1